MRSFLGDGLHEPIGKGGVAISMDCRGGSLEHVFLQAQRWDVKHEEVYRTADADGWRVAKSLGMYFDFYHEEQPHLALCHQALSDATRGADATKAFTCLSLLRRLRNERSSNGAQAVNSFVAARGPL
jgi:hypothetical protein